MTIEEKDIDRVKDFLSKKFRSGDKWIAFDQRNDPKEIFSFKDIGVAHRFCEFKLGVHFSFTFAPLTNVLKALTGAYCQTSQKINNSQFANEVAKHPIRTHGCNENIVNLLSNGGYYPIDYKKQVLPWTGVEKYAIVEHSHQGMFYESGHDVEIVKTFSSYYQAQKAFEQLLEKYSQSHFIHPDLKLIGQIKGQDIVLDTEGDPSEGSCIMFKRADTTICCDNKKVYETLQINDPAKPIDVYQPLMAKYNWLNSSLEFFDGRLQRVSPGAKVDFMNFSFLSVKPVEILNSLKQRIPGTIQNEEIKRQGLRFKPGL